MNSRVLVLWATWLSLAWAFLLDVLAAAGNHWVLERVLDGHFAKDGLPAWLRALSAIAALLVLAVARLAYLYFVNDVTRRQRNLGRFVMLVFTISATVDALAASQVERLNAVAAAVTVVGIAILRRRPVSDVVDLRTRR